jgi:2-polyprenyl-6-methoxyphenol hydroxylase-like FAD-dependent oxidoreductase
MGMTAAPTKPTHVLIVGAGPTGLVLALWLTRLGVSVRIIDKAMEPGTTSRALAVHARTLELYRQVGLADDVVARGLEFTGINFWARGKHEARADLSGIGKGVSPFPFIIMFPQDQHERLLIERLRRAGVEVERGIELVGFEQTGEGVVATMKGQGGGAITCDASYLAGCDGGRSRVREGLGIGFPGGTYDRVYYVADVELRGPTSNHELHIALDQEDLLAVFPMKGDGAARLIGTVKEESEEKRKDLTWDDVSHSSLERLHIQVEKLHWFSTYRVHHRVAEHFGRGRAFLLGDAAHVHSPVGGQGMNTGIGDAINLAWKLASVLQKRADAQVLQSYEPERIAFARRLVATTDRAFPLASSDGWFARAVRLDAVPMVASRLMSRPVVRRFMFRTVSQTAITYRQVSFNEGKAGWVRGGDRLPWVVPDAGAPDNFVPLSSLDWQVHVYGEPSPELTATCRKRGLPLHTRPWLPATATTGLAQNALYLVRPDSYVGLADPAASPDTLEAYLDARSLRFRP